MLGFVKSRLSDRTCLRCTHVLPNHKLPANEPDTGDLIFDLLWRDIARCDLDRPTAMHTIFYNVIFPYLRSTDELRELEREGVPICIAI